MERIRTVGLCWLLGCLVAGLGDAMFHLRLGILSAKAGDSIVAADCHRKALELVRARGDTDLIRRIASASPGGRQGTDDQ